MIDFIFDFTHLRIILAVVMLGYASYTDIAKREISDFIWIIFAVLAIVLIIFEPNITESLTTIAISLIVAPIVLIVWRIGLFGGADAFALIVLALLVPQVTLSGNTITPFTVFTNAVLFSIVPLFVNLTRNLFAMLTKKEIFEGFNETKKRRIIALFIGYKAKIPKHGFSIEKKVGKQKKLNLVMHHAEYSQFCTTPNTWITPGIPYLLFITAGFVIQLIYGDILFNALGLTV